MNRRVLVVEDDPKTAHLLQVYLQKDGYQVAVANDGKAGLDMARRVRPDLLILDLMLPQIDGLDICRLLRAESTVPIIMLTARSTEDDKLLGLDLGADDYVTKPFSPRELMARVRAVLRRATDPAEEGRPDATFSGLTISFRRHEVVRDGRVLSLTRTEFKLLEVMARNPGQAFTRLQLIDHVQGIDFEGFERTIDVHVANLRRKIEPDPAHPRYVKTVFGVGYRFEVDKSVP